MIKLKNNYFILNKILPYELYKKILIIVKRKSKNHIKSIKKDHLEVRSYLRSTDINSINMTNPHNKDVYQLLKNEIGKNTHKKHHILIRACVNVKYYTKLSLILNKVPDTMYYEYAQKYGKNEADYFLSKGYCKTNRCKYVFLNEDIHKHIANIPMYGSIPIYYLLIEEGDKIFKKFDTIIRLKYDNECI